MVDPTRPLTVSEEDFTPENVAAEILGYLNFSSGAPAPNFRLGLNRMFAHLAEREGRPPAAKDVARELHHRLEGLEGSTAAFEDVSQAKQVIDTTIEHLLPAYRDYHSDLLGHVPESEFDQPFFLARLFEVVLQEGAPFDPERIVAPAITRLNDYVGFRPVAVLENGRQMQTYEHEKFCPIPLAMEGAGVAVGMHEELIAATLRHLGWVQRVMPNLCETAMFELSRLEELAIDHRPHDHSHPVNKRTNYMFGEWDAHRVSTKGFFTRFVLRQIILNALEGWRHQESGLPHEEALFDASAVLTGTVLMASAISGAGPDSHLSGTSLSTLLPIVAGLRDEYYTTLMALLEGERKARLEEVIRVTQQPFGHVRQSLNISLARYGAMQLQLRELAMTYARMGYPEAARAKANEIPCLSTRFESELQTRLTQAKLLLPGGHLSAVVTLLEEIESLFRRGIECGALIDPWNVLGFQGQFPLFHSREDVAIDQRAETLIDFTGQTFELYTLTLGEAAAQGDNETADLVSKRFRTSAYAWDRYATATVNDLPTVRGEDTWEAAKQVATIMTEWRAGGEEAGNVSFWSEKIDSLTSDRALAPVVEVLLQKEDLISSMALLMRWLGLADDVAMDDVHPLLLRWLGVAIRTTPEDDPDRLRTFVRRLFDYMEANAEEYWSVPRLSDVTENASDEELDDEEDDEYGYDDDPFDDEDDEDNLFEAAYDQVVFRDSASDGFEGEMIEGGGLPMNTEYDVIARQLEPRLHFLHTVAQLWQMAGMALAMRARKANSPHDLEFVGHLERWRTHVRKTQRHLTELIDAIAEHDIPASYGDAEGSLEYDMQLQRKLSLMHQAINTHVSFRAAERTLSANITVTQPDGKTSRLQYAVVVLMRNLLLEDFDAVREQLPELLDKLAQRPLLYTPLENGGDPKAILEARNRQAILQFLLGGLARCGLLKQSFEVLQTAYRMERTVRPRGVAVTEFDRLFQTALNANLETVLRSAKSWDMLEPEQMTDLVHMFLKPFNDLWKKHASTMRLSSIEMLGDERDWNETREFIETYGRDLLNTRDLTLGHLRAMLHNGLDEYLAYLDETQDPLKPIKLLDDIDTGHIDEEDAVDRLENIYSVIVDKFDRFLEYNTTTTHSDYGDRLFCLFELLRVEAAYDRDAWNLAPFHIAHEVLCREGFAETAYLWEERLTQETRERAETHLQMLFGLERKYGVQLPSLRDHLGQQFVKSLAVNRMTALVPPAMQDSAETDRTSPSDAFARLQEEVDAYLESTIGSGIDIPDWLRNLEREVTEEEQNRLAMRLTEDLDLPLRTVTLDNLMDQIEAWPEVK